jgi:hypothetical protein
MNHRFRVLVCAGVYSATVLLAVPSPARGDSFTVEHWALTVGVDNDWPDVAAATFSTIQNPFVNQHAVSLPSDPATTAAAQYDISWLINYPYGSFNIASQLAVQDGDFIRSTASGVIYLHADSDLSLHLSGTFDYYLRGFAQMASIGFRAYDRDTDETMLYDAQSYYTDINPTGPGTLTLSGNGILPGGRNYALQYLARIETGGYSSTVADGSGSINLVITPEPATLGLLAPLVLAGACRTKRRRRALSP